MVDAKRRAAQVSVAVSAGLALAKLAAAVWTGSLALLSDALHSVLDVAATLLTLYAVTVAAKPADDDHTYGHGKVESITALVEVGLLTAVSGYVIVEAIGRLLAGAHEVAFSWVAVGVLVLAIVVDAFRVRALRRVAAETHSPALAANALHFSADLWQSVTVLAGFAALYAGFPQGDAIAALIVAAMIVAASIRLGRRTVDALMDTAPAGATDALRIAAQGVRGVVAVERVRARAVGPIILCEVSIAVPRALAPDRIVAVKQAVEAAIRERLPAADVTVTANPRALDDETVLERVLLIAAARRLPVHHVTVQHLDSGLAVALDLEVDGRMSLEAAHAIASKLEAAIRDDFGPTTEVETHIEPLETRDLPGRDVAGEALARIERIVTDIVGSQLVLRDVHDVRLRETERGKVLVLHCAADPRLTVAEVHRAVDSLEQAIEAAVPEIVRVVTHAEPQRPVRVSATF